MHHVRYSLNPMGPFAFTYKDVSQGAPVLGPQVATLPRLTQLDLV